MWVRLRVLLALGVVIALGIADHAVAETPTFGYLERVMIYPGPVTMAAKLDTGADNSAIHATNIKVGLRDGKQWVSFDVVTKDNIIQHFEKPVVRIARIKQLSGPAQERPVVMFEICLGAIKRSVNVSLVNRDGFDHRLLIGRSFLAGHALVDSGAAFTTEPQCP
jgi:hypothetical protein